MKTSEIAEAVAEEAVFAQGRVIQIAGLPVLAEGCERVTHCDGPRLLRLRGRRYFFDTLKFDTLKLALLFFGALPIGELERSPDVLAGFCCSFHPDRALAAAVIPVLLGAFPRVSTVQCEHLNPPATVQFIVHLSYAETSQILSY